MRLTRALWGLLAAMLLGVGIATWYLTRPVAPEPPWLGVVGVLAGDGVVGWRDGAAERARFSEPFGIAIANDDVVYVGDAGDSHRIRRISPDGLVTTLAGGGRGFADGRGEAARFSTPSGVAIDASGTLYVADTGNHAIRAVTPGGEVTTVAGDGIAGYRDGPAAQARFNGPVGVAVDASGRIVVADTYNDRIRVIERDGEVRTLAGGDTPGVADGTALDARFDTPCGVAVDAAGRILVADSGNGLVRAIAPDGAVTTLATPAGTFERPMALAVGARGDVYVADEAGRIVVLPAHGEARTLAGGDAGFADGVGSDARLRRPSAIGVRPPDHAHLTRLVVADAGNAMLRSVAPTRPAVPSRWPWGDVAFAPPRSPRPGPAFDAEAFARTPLLWPVAPMDGPHEVAGTFGEARGAAGQERFHAGLDVREVQGTLVRAVRDGIVSSPFSTFGFDTLNEGVRIGDLAYIHIRVGRRAGDARRWLASSTRASATGASRVAAPEVRADVDGSRFAPVYDADGVMLRMRVMRGAFFAAGDVVGTVNAFNHVHLNVGWSGEEINPLRFRLVQFRDRIPPTIEAGGVRLFDEASQPLNPDRVGPPRGRGRARRATRLPPLEPVVVGGRVRIVVDAYDQADGNKAYRRLGLHALGWQLLTRDGTPAPGFEAPRMTITFERQRRDADAARHVFASGSGIPVYGARRTRFLYVVTTTFRDGVATPGFWDSTEVPPGEYVLRVVAEDYSGNRATRDLRVVVMPQGGAASPASSAWRVPSPRD